MRSLALHVTLLFVLVAAGCSKNNEPKLDVEKDAAKKNAENPKDQAKDIKEGPKLSKFDPAKEALLAADREKRRLLIAKSEKKLLESLARLPAHREKKPPAVACLNGSFATFSSDGKYLAWVDELDVIKVWDLQNAKLWREFSPHTAMVNAILFTPDGKTLISAAYDNTIQFWNLEKNKSAESVTMGALILDLAISPDGKTLAYCRDGPTGATVGAIDTTTFAVKYTIPGYNAARIAISPSGDFLATLSIGTALLWDTSTGKEIAKLRFSNPSDSIAFSPDGRVLAIGCTQVRKENGRPIFNGNIVLWDLGTGKDRVITDLGETVKKIMFLPDGKALVEGAFSETIFLDNSGKILWKADLDGVNAVSPGGEILIAGRDGYVYPTASLLKKK